MRDKTVHFYVGCALLSPLALYVCLALDLMGVIR